MRVLMLLLLLLLRLLQRIVTIVVYCRVCRVQRLVFERLGLDIKYSLSSLSNGTQGARQDIQKGRNLESRSVNHCAIRVCDTFSRERPVLFREYGHGHVVAGFFVPNKAIGIHYCYYN